MGKQTNTTADYREEERLTCVLVLDSFNMHTNEIVSHTTLPLCLWPVNGQTLLDYTIYSLIRSGIQEILLLATSHIFELRSYLTNSQWARSHPKTIKLIPCTKARSLGECLKDLEQENVINHHFLLLYGNGILLTNQKLNTLFDIHKENIKQDKNCIMTLVYRTLNSSGIQHSSHTDDQHLIITRDATTHRLYDYSKQQLDSYAVSLEIFEKQNATVETLYCPLDCHLAVCSADVLHLFKDNFDFLTIKEFVKGVLSDEEIAGHRIYSHLYETGYFLPVHNLHLYMKGALDIIRRWIHPLVPERLASIQKMLPTSNSNASTPLVASSPIVADRQISLFRSSFPVVFDKHNIYKQGDVALDRQSDIQQDVYIGHSSRIASGVRLRSSIIGQNCIIGKNTRIENSILWNHVQIGENCLIENAIICDNVLVRNDAQIGKKCILCKGVIIGSGVTLQERMTIVASTSTVSGISDEVEIDDDALMLPEPLKRTNSKQRRSSTRLSEKSLSDKSVASSVEDILTSDTDLVGVDGLGRKLVFTSAHDDLPESLDPTDDEDEQDDDDDQANAFDAWGALIERPSMADAFRGVDDKEDDDDETMHVPRSKQPITQPKSNLSDGTTNEDDDESLNVSSSASVNSVGDDVSEFQGEVVSSLKRAYLENLNIENVIVELNMLKPTYDVSPTEFDQSITRAVFLLPLQMRNTTNSNYMNILKQTIVQTTQFILKNYMKTTNEQAQMTLLNELESICLTNLQPIGERIAKILGCLYDNDVFDERWVLKWYKEKLATGTLTTTQSEQKIYYDKLREFIEWLENADSDDED